MIELPGIIKNDILRKFTALFFASLIWETGRRQVQQEEIFRDIPVTIETENLNQILIDKEKPKITVRLRGSKKRLQSISNTDIKVSVNLKSDLFGVHHLAISEECINLPAGVFIDEILTERIKVNTDKSILKLLPVNVRTRGLLPPGFKMTSLSSIPKKVELKGASRVLANIREVFTEAVDFDKNIEISFDQDVKLIIPSGIKEAVPTSVKVKVEVTEVNAEHGFTDLTVDILNSTLSNLYTDQKIPRVNITLKGSRKLLQTLNKQSVRPFIDITSIYRPGIWKRPVRVWLEEPGVTPSKIDPLVIDIELFEIGKPKPTLEEHFEKFKK